MNNNNFSRRGSYFYEAWFLEENLGRFELYSTVFFTLKPLKSLIIQVRPCGPYGQQGPMRNEGTAK